MDIPSKYNPTEVEPRILKDWLSSNLFHARTDSGKIPYAIVIPPPNITGILHMGHALNNTLQDVLIRYYRLKGYEALWMPGTDHAGIATQNVVEKQLAKEGLRKEDIGRQNFQKRLWAWRDEYGSTIINQLKRLGASCDWERRRFTMDKGYSEAVKEVFIRLYKKGLVYRGSYIINWCPRCHTALSDEEATRKEIDGWLYYIKYPLKEPQISKHPGIQNYIVVATTRPETMLGDTAVAINPHDKRYNWLKNQQVILPVVGRELKVIEDEAVDAEFGTGVVKVTPAHDPVDFDLGKKHKLKFINIMNGDATLNENVPEEFIGLDRFEAREALLSILKRKELIEKKEPHIINAGHCYRCNTVVEPRLSRQWFVKMKPLAEAATKVVEEDKIRFYPARWKKVYLNWMYNIQDWCISRQIWWGHRLPVWYCKACAVHQKPQADDNFNAEQSAAKAKGVIVSKGKPETCPDCGSTDLAQDPDVLDTWFSSWLWPFATMGWPADTAELKYFYPTNCLVTASEILFFWVARMIMAGLEFTGEIPFRDVLIHGTVRDQDGIKMSKSLGNIIDPLEVIKVFGADALRFSLMLSAASGSDVYLSDERFLVGRNFCNKIWNATRFILLKINDRSLELRDLQLDCSDPVDAWLFSELNTTIKEVSSHIETYSLNEATKKIYDFFWHIFCDWYIEIVKDRLTAAKAKTLIRVLIDSMKLLNPIMPFISEEVVSLLRRSVPVIADGMLAGSSWPSPYPVSKDQYGLCGINALIETIKSIRTIKNDLGLAQKKVGLQVCVRNQDDLKLWQNHASWIQRLTLADSIRFEKQLEKVLYENSIWAINLAIETLDMRAFLATLDKKLVSLSGVVEKIKQRLSNRGFLAKAAPEAIEKEKKKYQDISEQLARIKRLKDAFV